MENSQLHKGDHSVTCMPLKLLRLKQVQAVTGMCKSQIYQLQKQGEFPHSVCLSGARTKHGKRGGVGWLSHEVQAYIESRVKASRDNAGGAQ